MPFSERFYVYSITRNNSSKFGENLRSLEKIDNPHFTATIATSGGLRFEYVLRAVSLFLNLFELPPPAKPLIYQKSAQFNKKSIPHISLSTATIATPGGFCFELIFRSVLLFLKLFC